MRGLHKAKDAREIGYLQQAGSPRPTRTGDSLLFDGAWGLDELLLFKGFWPSANSPPATEVWFTRTGDSLHGKGTWRLEKSLLFKGFWPSVESPPATEVWFRCAPPHGASLINGNGVVDRELLMSEGAAAASSCEAGPLSPGVTSQK